MEALLLSPEIWSHIESEVAFPKVFCKSGYPPFLPHREEFLLRPGEMTHLVKCLPCKPEELSSIPRTHMKSQTG